MMIRVFASVVVLFMAAGSGVFGQDVLYHRIAINDGHFEGVKDVLSPDHFYTRNGQTLLEVSDRRLQDLDRKGIEYNVLISELTTYYQEQNRETHSRSRLSHDISLIKFENFKLRPLGGYLTYDDLKDELIK